MEKTEIRAKCRKVYLVTTNNRIFGDGRTPNEYQFVPTFRQKENADANAKHSRENQDMYRNAKDIYGKPKTPPDIYKTVAFYLVPASKIDIN